MRYSLHPGLKAATGWGVVEGGENGINEFIIRAYSRNSCTSGILCICEKKRMITSYSGMKAFKSY